METFAELMEKVTALFPDAVVEEQGGEIVIWPGLVQHHDGSIGPAKIRD